MQGVPYRKTFDGVMAHCLQAGLIDKWEKDLYSIYLKEAQDNKTPQQKKKEKMEADEKRNDGQVTRDSNFVFKEAFICFNNLYTRNKNANRMENK